MLVRFWNGRCAPRVLLRDMSASFLLFSSLLLSDPFALSTATRVGVCPFSTAALEEFAAASGAFLRDCDLSSRTVLPEIMICCGVFTPSASILSFFTRNFSSFTKILFRLFLISMRLLLTHAFASLPLVAINKRMTNQSKTRML